MESLSTPTTTKSPTWSRVVLATAGLCVGDFIAEVNGKSTTGGSFGKLLPAAATAEIRLRLIRVQVVEPDHLHLPDLLA